MCGCTCAPVCVCTYVNAGRVCWWGKVLVLPLPAANSGWRGRDGDQVVTALGSSARISPSAACCLAYIRLCGKDTM